MKQSQLFGKTLHEFPKDEVSANAKFLERGGFVYKTMAGVYDYLPLGFRVLAKINAIIREEMNAIGGQELFLSALQPKERWEKTGRWKLLGEEVMYQFKDHSGHDVGLASTHEEAVAEIAKHSIFSYKDLPLLVYQIQTKFRDELRAKSGVIRGREFLMKDLYSFHTDAKDLDNFYWQFADKAYKKIFKRCGLDVYVVEASGGIFTKEFTHEYQVLSDAGEDFIFYCEQCAWAQNKEIASLKEGEKCAKCNGIIKTGKSIEVGNIFHLGTKYSEGIGLYFTDKNGEKKPAVMGSYGIGPTRVLGSIAETHHDEKGIIWPDSAAPFQAHIIELLPKDEKSAKQVKMTAENCYKQFLAKGVEVLYDERVGKTAGEKFADADLIGIPWRVVISEKTTAQKKIEMKRRDAKNAAMVSLQQGVAKISRGRRN